MKKILLALLLMLSACTPHSIDNTDTYQGEGIGKQGKIIVDVVIKDDKIEHIELVKHSEVPGFSGKMIQLADEIISKNSIDVDTIAGATLTSQGFIDAVKDVGAFRTFTNIPGPGVKTANFAGSGVLIWCTPEERREPAGQRCAHARRCSEASRPRRAA